MECNDIKLLLMCAPFLLVLAFFLINYKGVDMSGLRRMKPKIKR